MKFDQKPGRQTQVMVTEQDVEKIFSIDAVHTNKFFITNQTDGMVRVCFADADPSGKFMYPRFTVAMSMNSFASLAQLVSDNLRNIANSMAQAAQQGSEPQEKKDN